VARQLTGLETVLECFGERRLLWQQRADASPEVAGGRDAEKLAQSAARPAVVGN
jgi:hypothetical protein